VDCNNGGKSAHNVRVQIRLRYCCYTISSLLFYFFSQTFWLRKHLRLALHQFNDYCAVSVRRYLSFRCYFILLHNFIRILFFIYTIPIIVLSRPLFSRARACVRTRIHIFTSTNRIWHSHIFIWPFTVEEIGLRDNPFSPLNFTMRVRMCTLNMSAVTAPAQHLYVSLNVQSILADILLGRSVKRSVYLLFKQHWRMDLRSLLGSAMEIEKRLCVLCTISSLPLPPFPSHYLSLSLSRSLSLSVCPFPWRNVFLFFLLFKFLGIKFTSGVWECKWATRQMFIARERERERERDLSRVSAWFTICILYFSR